MRDAKEPGHALAAPALPNAMEMKPSHGRKMPH
jgi:hypothetical protein